MLLPLPATSLMTMVPPWAVMSCVRFWLTNQRLPPLLITRLAALVFPPKALEFWSCSTPPLLMVTTLAAPLRLLLPLTIKRALELMVIPPVSVLVPTKLTQPLVDPPFTMSPLLPASTELIVAVLAPE